MGIFDKIKKVITSEIKEVQIEPVNKQYEKMRAKEDAYFEKHFDFSSIESINKISNKSKTPFDSVTGTLPYKLQKEAIKHKKTNIALAIACLEKANAIAIATGIGCENYQKLSNYQKIAGNFTEAKLAENQLKKEQTKLKDSLKKQNENSMKILNTDLVEVTYVGRCCEKCAMYRERVYSMSGKDKRFPKFPEFLNDNLYHCGLSTYRFIAGVDYMTLSDGTSFNNVKQIIKHSNRPFIDDRAEEEKQQYNEYIQEKIQAEQDRSDYDLLLEFLPDIAPKSFGGYRRMKNTNSVNYQKIKQQLDEYKSNNA